MLPIDPLLPEVVRHLRESNTLVIEAPPGAGKTTRVPAALLELQARDVLVLEPRRLAARLAARFVSAGFGERPGGTVGYQVRFEEVAGPKTRLRFLTEGVLTRRLLSDPDLNRTGCVVLDEFHERHLEGDLALTLLRRLQKRRPDLRIVVMSATLDTRAIAEYLGGARVLRSEGRQYPLEIEYTPHSPAPVEEQVRGALARVAERRDAGHVLVFLPGAAEIRRALKACEPLARRHGWLVLPLHGDQSPEEQDRAVAPSEQTKVILSTNVAESSVTIEGVTAVIDSGLARVASHSPWSGLPVLQVARVSQASANQRAGRAGRTGPGCCIRLYPLEDFVRRPAHDVPEIARADLAPAALLLSAMGLEGFESLDWLDRPPAAAVEHATLLLQQLAGQTANGGLPHSGLLEEMSRYPLHPRLARLVIEAEKRGVWEAGCTAAGLLSAGARLEGAPRHKTRSDLIALMESEWDPRAAQTVRQVKALSRRAGGRAKAPAGDPEDALLLSVLAAFPDRVARRRQTGQLMMASGGSVQLAPSSTVTECEFLVAVEAEDRSDQKSPVVRIASGIDPAWLLDVFPERVKESARVEWNRTGERVEAVTALLFDQIVIEESRRTPDPEAAASLLAAKAAESGLARFTDADDLEAFLCRARFAAEHGAVAEPDPQGALRILATGLRSFLELESAARDGGLRRAMEQQMAPGARRLLEEIAPEQIKLPRGRSVAVHYEAGQPPWIASRLQDFFGMRQTPAIARGAVPLVVRLLAPSQRPVQTTTDLAGFWQRLYPQVRRELARRYPKHAWPEDPLKG